jgi:hypothetical protein
MKYYKTIGFSTDTFYLAAYLLFFMEPAAAWYTLCHIYSNIIPRAYWPLQYYTEESKVFKSKKNTIKNYNNFNFKNI